MKWKANLILLGIMALTGLIVWLMMIGIQNRQNSDARTGGDPLLSDDAAKAYVLQQKLLTTVDEVKSTNPGGPSFKMIRGTDSSNQQKVVWLTGDEQRGGVKLEGSILINQGVPEATIHEKLQAIGIGPNQIEDIYVTPYDYTSQKIVWFVLEKGARKHMLWYDFLTGEKIWEAYQDPTAWEK